MPRTARKYLDGHHFHVMVQGIGKEYIYPTDDFKGYYLACLQRFKEKTNTKILGFCVMGNHAHLLLSVNNATDLGLFMQSVNFEYARYYNRTRKRVGYVFRERYRSEIIKKIDYLVYCLAYIHNNPIKAKMIKKAGDYNYSSYTNYIEETGIVDFKEASKYYDITSENIKAIMKERTALCWMEHDDREYEDAEKVLKEILNKYRINKKKLREENLLWKEISQEIKQRSGLSLRKTADLLEINREALRRVVSVTPSP